MNVLEDLIKKRNRVVEEIGELLSMEDSVHCDVADLRDRLQELNDDIKATKEEEAKEAKEKEERYSEVLESGDYSALASEYRQLDREINKWRNCEEKYKDCDSYFQIGGVREQRRRVGDRMLEIERCKQAGVTI